MEGLPSGTVLGTVTAKDPDEGENGTVYYSLSGECYLSVTFLCKISDMTIITFTMSLYPYLFHLLKALGQSVSLLTRPVVS